MPTLPKTVRKIRFNYHYQIELIKEEDVLLIVTENRHFSLKSKLYLLVAPYLNGEYTKDEIVDALCESVSIAQIYFVLNKLEKNGHILEVEEKTNLNESAYWSELGIHTNQTQKKIKTIPISILSYGCDYISYLQESLEELGFTLKKETDFVIVVTDDYMRPEIVELSKRLAREKKRWFIIKPHGVETWIGPTIYPDETACFECLLSRLKRNLEIRTFVNDRRESNDALTYAWLPSSIKMTYNMAATYLAKIFLSEKNFFDDKMLSVNMNHFNIKEHQIIKQTHCKICSNKEMKKKIAPKLTNREKQYTQDGGHRNASPDETYNKYAHHVSHLTGIVKFLEPSQNLNSDTIHVYISGYNAASRKNNLDIIKKNMRSSSSGKGATKEQARTGGLCEALERYSGVFTGNEYRIKSSYENLKKDAIHPNDCMKFSQKQYENAKVSNKTCNHFNHVPQRFDEKEEIDWTPIWSLSKKKFKYLPTSYCYFSHPKAKKVAACSNGNAAGASLEDAVLQGFLELIERDCVSLWWYNMLQKRGVDLQSFKIPFIDELITAYKEKSRDIWVLDLTSDFNIPCFIALSKRVDISKQVIIFGFGCHLDPKIALLRALTEMNQCLGSTLSFNEEESALMDKHMTEWFNTATVENQPYLQPDTSKSLVTLSNFKDLSTDDILDDITVCQQLIENKGMEMLILDQTREDATLPVVKVFVPGLTHFWKRFDKGRLYDVPVEMGWSDTPKTEEEFNPIAMFI